MHAEAGPITTVSPGDTPFSGRYRRTIRDGVAIFVPIHPPDDQTEYEYTPPPPKKPDVPALPVTESLKGFYMAEDVPTRFHRIATRVGRIATAGSLLAVPPLFYDLSQSVSGPEVALLFVGQATLWAAALERHLNSAQNTRKHLSERSEQE